MTTNMRHTPLHRNWNDIPAGLCPTSKFDSKFQTTEAESDGHSILRGYHDSKIYYSSEQDSWVMSLYSDSTVYATVNSSTFPHGLQYWKVHGDTCEGGDAEGNVPLNLNSCNRTEFGCHDGHCVDMDRRCDGKLDCPDKSGLFTKRKRNFPT